MNAKHEFLKFVKENNLQLKCATVQVVKYSTEGSSQKIECNPANLPVNYTQEELDNFLSKLDFEDSSNVTSKDNEPRFEIGNNTIWFTDGNWGSYEFDPVAWGDSWVHHIVPAIPDALKR